jgi:hypothetical protein
LKHLLNAYYMAGVRERKRVDIEKALGKRKIP